MEKNCIFCKIVTGEEPSSKVYEDDKIIGFMDIHPIHEGQCLLIPKYHIDHFSDVEDSVAAHIMVVAQKVARKIRQELNPQRVGYGVAGYDVSHAHFLILPMHHEDDLTSEHFAILKEGKIRFARQQVPPTSRDKLDEIASKIHIANE